jgi:acyl-CoA thioesterase I
MGGKFGRSVFPGSLRNAQTGRVMEPCFVEDSVIAASYPHLLTALVLADESANDQAGESRAEQGLGRFEGRVRRFLPSWVYIFHLPFVRRPSSKRSGWRAFVAKWGMIAAAIFLFTALADAASLRIVAVGASNTSGWLIRESSAYPAALERMLKANRVDAEVINAGVPFDTTSKMLARLDAAVPPGTHIVILQPGGNDLRFFGSAQQRAANIAEMKRRLEARFIAVIIYDEQLPQQNLFDGIHLTPRGHTIVAAALLPRVMSLIRSPEPRR